MREIKFRAWQKSDQFKNKMVYNVPLFNDHNVGLDIILAETSYGRFMQYTGKRDNTGREVYESDIVIDWEGIDRYVIAWNENWACFEFKRLTSQNDTQLEDFETIQYAARVIGNIYENGDLLK